jgi:hypothetical protein
VFLRLKVPYKVPYRSCWFLFLRWVFFDTDFVVFSHSHYIQIYLGYNIVLLFDSYCTRFESTRRWYCWTKLKFLVKTLYALKIGKEKHIKVDKRWKHKIVTSITEQNRVIIQSSKHQATYHIIATTQISTLEHKTIVLNIIQICLFVPGHLVIKLMLWIEERRWVNWRKCPCKLMLHPAMFRRPHVLIQ